MIKACKNCYFYHYDFSKEPCCYCDINNNCWKPIEKRNSINKSKRLNKDILNRNERLIEIKS